MEIPGGISESEDNWEEFSDFGEVNGHTDSESDLEEKLHIPTSSKRGLEEEEEEEEKMEEDENEDDEEEEESSEGDIESQSDMTVDANESDSDSRSSDE